MEGARILFAGATGYIGGSLLSALLESKNSSIQKSTIFALVRGEENAKILAKKGVKTILFRSLDETDFLEQVASEYDVVLYAATGSHLTAPKALISGLGKRQRQTGKDAYFIHTSGTSNLSDHPTSKSLVEDRVFSDTEDIYSYEKSREGIEPYDQRTAELSVVEAGLKFNVKTYVIMSPTIYGLGTGSFNRFSMQIPALIRGALKSGHAEVVGDGKSIWNYVHIADLVTLYEALLVAILTGENKDIPSGDKGILFSETGEFSWLQLSQGIAKAGHELGVFPSTEVHSLSLEEAAKRWTGGNEEMVELGFASNSRTRSDIARKRLHWKPQKTAKDFEATFLEEFKTVMAMEGGH